MNKNWEKSVFFNRNAKETIEKSTCTDTKQKWGKIKKDAKNMYEAVPIKDFCHVKEVKLKFQVPEIELKVLRDAQRILIEGIFNNN